MVEPGKCLNEHVTSLVSELISTSDEQIQGLVQIEIIVAADVI